VALKISWVALTFILAFIWSPEMRNFVVTLVFTVCVGVAQASSAGCLTPAQTRETADRLPLKGQLPDSLQKLGVGLISKARAAECTAEGETCTADEQCCPGLECAGGPPATCTIED
jgi:hypothetical protein